MIQDHFASLLQPESELDKFAAMLEQIGTGASGPAKSGGYFVSDRDDPQKKDKKGEDEDEKKQAEQLLTRLAANAKNLDQVKDITGDDDDKKAIERAAATGGSALTPSERRIFAAMNPKKGVKMYQVREGDAPMSTEDVGRPNQMTNQRNIGFLQDMQDSSAATQAAYKTAIHSLLGEVNRPPMPMPPLPETNIDTLGHLAYRDSLANRAGKLSNDAPQYINEMEALRQQLGGMAGAMNQPRYNPTDLVNMIKGLQNASSSAFDDSTDLAKYQLDRSWDMDKFAQEQDLARDELASEIENRKATLRLNKQKADNLKAFQDARIKLGYDSLDQKKQAATLKAEGSAALANKKTRPVVIPGTKTAESVTVAEFPEVFDREPTLGDLKFKDQTIERDRAQNILTKHSVNNEIIKESKKKFGTNSRMKFFMKDMVKDGYLNKLLASKIFFTRFIQDEVGNISFKEAQPQLADTLSLRFGIAKNFFTGKDRANSTAILNVLDALVDKSLGSLEQNLELRQADKDLLKTHRPELAEDSWDNLVDVRYQGTYAQLELPDLKLGDSKIFDTPEKLERYHKMKKRLDDGRKELLGRKRSLFDQNQSEAVADDEDDTDITIDNFFKEVLGK